MSEIVISTEGLTRDFQTVRAVDNLNIEVQAGTIFGFLGPNGSGKTTTIRMLLGLLEPTSGKAEVLGVDVAKSADQIRQRSGALLEHNGIYERLTAEENLDLFGRIWNMPSTTRRARIQELLQSFGLWDRRKETGGTWSRGMRQKLAVARAMLHHPALIFLDEPTASLDPVASASLRDELAGMSAREGVTVFLTTHNLPEAEKLCSRVAVIREGKLLAMGPPRRTSLYMRRQADGDLWPGFTPHLLTMLQNRHEIRLASLANGHLVLEFRDQPDVAALVPLLVGAGAEIDEIRRGAQSLEEVFLALVEEDQT